MLVTAAASWRASAWFQARSSWVIWISSLDGADFSWANRTADIAIRASRTMEKVFISMTLVELWNGMNGTGSEFYFLAKFGEGVTTTLPRRKKQIPRANTALMTSSRFQQPA